MRGKTHQTAPVRVGAHSAPHQRATTHLARLFSLARMRGRFILLAALLLAAHVAPSHAIFGWGSAKDEEEVLKPMTAYSECDGAAGSVHEAWEARLTVVALKRRAAPRPGPAGGAARGRTSFTSDGSPPCASL